MPCEVEDERMTGCLAQYRAAWSARAYDARRVGGEDELRDVTQDPEVAAFQVAPAGQWTQGAPPVGTFGDGEGKFLWVIRADVMPYAKEDGPLGASIAGRGRLAHTNLTGGADAHCGGELWFQSESCVWLTGGSGRYPPRSREELEAVVAAVRKAGYDVRSAGWSDELGGPARYFREEAA